MKKILLITICLIITSCTPSEPKQGKYVFKHEGHEVSFFTDDPTIPNKALARIKRILMSEAQYSLKHKSSFVPKEMFVSKVSADKLAGLESSKIERWKNDTITISASLTFEGENSFGMEGAKTVSLIFDKKGKNLGSSVFY
jgi:hypothetical protein